MPKFVGLVFADSHLRCRRGDEQFALEQLVDLALQERVEVVVGAGDLLDRQTNRSGPVSFFMSQVDRLRVGGVAFRFIQGNHDRDDPPWLAGLGHHCHKNIFRFGPYLAYGLDCQARGLLQQALAEVPRECSLLLCHQSWGAWMGEETLPQGEFCEVPAHVQVLVTGDYHKYVSGRYKNAGGAEMLVVSPGATCQQRSNEPSEHYCLLMAASGRSVRRRLRSRPFVDFGVLNTSADVDRVVSSAADTIDRARATAEAAGLPDTICKPWVRVTYARRLGDQTVRRIEKVLGDRVYVSWRELDDVVAAAVGEGDVSVAGDAVTPESVLSVLLDRRAEPAAFALAARILAAGDLFAEEYRRAENEYLATANPSRGVEQIVQDS